MGATPSVDTAEQRPEGLLDCLAADVRAVRRHRDGRLAAFLFPNLFAVAVFRVANWIGRHGLAAPAHALCLLVTVLTGAEISWRAQIGPGLFLDHPVGVILPDVVAGRNLRMGAAAVLGNLSGESTTNPRHGAPTVGDDVRIYARATVLGPIHVGDGAMVGAHALVMQDVPAGAVARGIPARNYLAGGEVGGA